jgi:hypothetical protein
MCHLRRPCNLEPLLLLTLLRFLYPFRCLGCLRSGGIRHALRPDALSLLSFSEPPGL